MICIESATLFAIINRFFNKSFTDLLSVLVTDCYLQALLRQAALSALLSAVVIDRPFTNVVDASRFLHYRNIVDNYY